MQEEAGSQGCRAKTCRGCLIDRKALTCPVRIVDVDKECDLVGGQAGSDAEREAEQKLPSVGPGNDGCSSRRERDRDAGDKVVDAGPASPRPVVDAPPSSARPWERALALAHVVDHARDRDRACE